MPIAKAHKLEVSVDIVTLSYYLNVIFSVVTVLCNMLCR